MLSKVFTRHYARKIISFLLSPKNKNKNKKRGRVRDNIMAIFITELLK